MGVFDDPIDVQQIQNPINWQLERKNTTRMIICIYVQSHIPVYLSLIINKRKLANSCFDVILANISCQLLISHYQIIGFPIQSLSYG